MEGGLGGGELGGWKESMLVKMMYFERWVLVVSGKSVEVGRRWWRYGVEYVYFLTSLNLLYIPFKRTFIFLLSIIK